MDSAFFWPWKYSVIYITCDLFFLNLRGINIIQMMFWNDNNFGVLILANFWIDNSSFIMQDSGYSNIISGFNWTCNRQLSIHIDFTTLNGFDLLLSDLLSFILKFFMPFTMAHYLEPFPKPTSKLNFRFIAQWYIIEFSFSLTSFRLICLNKVAKI